MIVALLALALAGSPANLTITYRANAGSPAQTWTLRCDPTGGTLPSRDTACRRLAALAAPFAPTPPGVACSQIYGGPQEAVVRGTFRGRRLWTKLMRRDGCAIARWNRVAFLFPAQARR